MIADSEPIRKKGLAWEQQENLSFMRCFVIAVLVLQAVTVIDIETDSRVTLALQIGDVIYTASSLGMH